MYRKYQLLLWRYRYNKNPWPVGVRGLVFCEMNRETYTAFLILAVDDVLSVGE